MTRRDSEYPRVDRDRYETPPEAVAVLMPYLPPRLYLWEPACASGKMVRALAAAGHSVRCGDIADAGGGTDFLKVETAPRGIQGIVTNPPYSLAREFVEHGIALMKPVDGFVAMLLPLDYGTAVSRRHLFRDCPIFALKIEMTWRIRWFEGTLGNPKENHCWCVWDHRHRGGPAIRYAGKPAVNDDNRASIWREPYVPMR
ncbi:class I SAM-dependent methyltransferase [Bradyrhizobium sp. SZCCHNRI1002]|uniref:class I SAM-dependent methyltransferase n=1 Tax=Bradyrhizobium sp. SZCCHNRI1002 TaxID=3057274 RepID=UPI0028EFA2C7|nr:class I SAM-dependent methyltransferase [Bradyrhizobium sp. SZCCHNRI1002]